jgi:hypothetical protein
MINTNTTLSGRQALENFDPSISKIGNRDIQKFMNYPFSPKCCVIKESFSVQRKDIGC